MATTDNHPKPFTGKHFLMIMIAFFGVIIAVNLTMAVLATRSWTGLVVQNSYVASQEFNDHLAKSRAQVKLGWSAPLGLTPDEAVVEARDANGRPIEGAEVVLILKRSITDRDDATVRLDEVAPGLYRADLDLAPVQWDTSLRITSAAGVTFRQDQKIMLKAGE